MDSGTYPQIKRNPSDANSAYVVFPNRIVCLEGDVSGNSFRPSEQSFRSSLTNSEQSAISKKMGSNNFLTFDNE